jgi:LCP family protein required for cell wall assembly
MPAKTSSRRTSASSDYDFNEAEHDLSKASRGSRSAGHGLAKPKKKRKKVRSPLWAKLTATLGVLVALIGFGGVVAAKSLMGDLTGSIEVGSTTEDSTGQQTKQAAGTALKGAIDILMLGLDTREGWAANTSRADTIIILHIPASHDQAYLISIPRDAEVPIPSWSKAGFPGTSHDKINSAFFFGSQRNQGWTGGAGLMKKTVSELTGITFDGVVIIDFDGFRNVIAALGGVYMCVERDTWSSHYIRQANGGHKYYSYHGDYKLPNSWIHKKGCRNMQPWEALDYSRQRYGLPNSDYDRQRHQQQLLRSMAKKATSAGIITNPLKLGELTKAAGSSLKMDTGGVPLDDFIFTLKALAGSDLVALKTNSGTYAKSSVGTGEGITEGTRELFTAAKDDRLGEFIMENPQYLISDKQPTVAPK